MKKDLKKLALLGIAGAMVSQGAVHADEENTSSSNPELLAAGCGAHGCNHNHGCSNNNGYNHGCGSNTNNHGCGSSGNNHGCGNNGNSRSRGFVAEADTYTSDNAGTLMTEDQLKSQLNDQGKKMYSSMSPEGKALAVKLASRSCKGTNDCKGQNSCKSDANSCAGKGNCAGTSQCSFKDKNMAVKVAAQQQADKRMQTNAGFSTKTGYNTNSTTTYPSSGYQTGSTSTNGY